MNTHDKYKLPPLPKPAMNEGDTALYAAFAGSQLTDYARHAIEADRKRRQSEAEEVCAEAYQVVGSLLSDLGIFETHHAEKILDNLSQAKMVHDDVLPWPSFDRKRRGKPVSLMREAAMHLTNWLDMGECDCEGPGHQCGRTQVKSCRDRLLAAAPQPTESVLYTSQKALDLASRSDAVISVGLTRVPQMSWNVPLYTAPQPDEPESVTKHWQDGDDSNMVSRVEAPAEPAHETARTAGNGAESGMNTGPQGGAHSASSYSVCGCNSDDCRVNGCLSLRQAQSAMAPGGGGMPAEPVKVPSDADAKHIQDFIACDGMGAVIVEGPQYSAVVRALLARYGKGAP